MFEGLSQDLKVRLLEVKITEAVLPSVSTGGWGVMKVTVDL